MTRRASISSLTFIVPISAVTADPLRPTTMMAISRGPSSRMRLRETRSGMKELAPSLPSSVEACMARMKPTLRATRLAIGKAWTPIRIIWERVCAGESTLGLVRPQRRKE